MPRSHQPKEIWRITRKSIRCNRPLALNECHIDHIKSGKLGTNEDENLRTLCITCHVLRADFRHNGMRANAISKGIIPPDWRHLVWEEHEIKSGE